MRKFLTIAFIGLSVGLSAQQDALYSQYMANPLVINPAWNNNQNAISGFLSHRSQWVGLDGAPTTQTISVHSPIPKANILAGVQLVMDRIGSKRATGILMSYSYGFKLGSGRLNFGLRGGMWGYGVDPAKLDYRTASDPQDMAQLQKSNLFTFDFGSYYSSKRWFAGLALVHINEPGVVLDTAVAGGPSASLDAHAFLNGGYHFPLSESVELTPSAMVRVVGQVPISVDLNVMSTFNQKLFTGLSFRSSGTLVAMAGYYVMSNLRFGYSFDLPLGAPAIAGQSGSHEIFLSYDHKLFKERSTNPRY